MEIKFQSDKMHFTKDAISKMERIKKINLINSITGIKPTNLIGTKSNRGESNLAIFSSVIHLGSNPPLIGFVSRPDAEVPRHTLQNIQENGFYTINHVPENYIKNAHYTSAKFPKEISEFEACNLTEQYQFHFQAPFVKESNLKIGLKFLQSIPIEINGTVLILGEIIHLVLPENSLDENYHLDLSQLKSTGISGLNTYYKFQKINQFPYARPENLPEFKR